jgi:hypothetical protein
MVLPFLFVSNSMKSTTHDFFQVSLTEVRRANFGFKMTSVQIGEKQFFDNGNSFIEKDQISKFSGAASIGSVKASSRSVSAKRDFFNQPILPRKRMSVKPGCKRFKN